MDGPVFDAMLKTALMEALEEDLKDLGYGTGQTAVRTSAAPCAGEGRSLAAHARILAHGEEPAGKEPAGRKRRPVRWLLVAVIAAILAGTGGQLCPAGRGIFPPDV